MTAVTDPPSGGDSFRIGMLWTDGRYRSVTIQIIALILVMLGVSYLVSNVIQNLAELGKTFDFGFMSTPSSYDINQRLIEYTSRSSHATAAVVGILNTLLIAFLGCIAATVIGVAAGVARLSKNWLIASLMTVYVEVVRNIPLLVQILLFAAVFTEFLPGPRQSEIWSIFGFETGIVATNRGFYTPAPVWHAGSVFVILALIAGVVGSVVYSRRARKVQQQTGEELPTGLVRLGLILGLPILVYLLVWMFSGAPITLQSPELKGFNYQGGIHMRISLVALWMALSIYTGGFIAENVRAGIMSVSKGQTEASYALGLRPNRTMSLIILPQALRVIIPPLISQYLNLTKNSSLAIAVGYMDATGTLGGITLNQTGKEFETILLLMAFYLSISLTIAFIMNLYNEQVKLVERTSGAGAGLSIPKLFDSMTGPWEQLKKGDAAQQPHFGVASWLNLVVLLYAGMLASLLSYLFLAQTPEMRPPYFEWSTASQLAYLLTIVGTLATLMTALFKHFRVVELAAVTAVFWAVSGFVGVDLAAVTGVPFGGPLGLGLQLVALAYLIVGARPNVTYLGRIRRDA